MLQQNNSTNLGCSKSDRTLIWNWSH